MANELMARILDFLKATTYTGDYGGPIIEHTKLHKHHAIHLPEYQCEACALVKELEKHLATKDRWHYIPPSQCLTFEELGETAWRCLLKEKHEGPHVYINH
jgi:superoxide dismutase